MFDQVRKKAGDAARDPATAMTTAAIVAATGLATRSLLVTAWRALREDEPPRDPARPDVSWPVALGWTTTLGLTVGLARLAARRMLHVDR